MKSRSSIKIELTPEQRKQIQQTAEKADSQELAPEVLEERIAPTSNLNLSKSNVN